MTYPSTEGCKWVFSGGPKPPALMGKRVLQCRLWLRSFTMGLPHVKAYPTPSRTLSIRVAEKENMWIAFQKLPLKNVLCYLHSHFLGQSNLQGHAISKEQVNAIRLCAQRKGTGILTCSKDYQTCLHTSEGLWGSNEPRHKSVFKNCKHSTTVSSFIENKIPHHREYSRPLPQRDWIISLNNVNISASFNTQKMLPISLDLFKDPT